MAGKQRRDYAQYAFSGFPTGKKSRRSPFTCAAVGCFLYCRIEPADRETGGFDLSLRLDAAQRIGAQNCQSGITSGEPCLGYSC